MKPATWLRVKQLFEQALELPEGRRRAFLEEQCGGEAELLAEVERLLEEDAASDDFLDTPGARSLPELLQDPVRRLGPGARIGRYELRRELASGGMGTVYEAIQDQPRRPVALKTMRMGFTSPQVLRRFQFEAEVLGRLRHPGIAQIYESGTFGVEGEDDEGGAHPYFAMEYVEGARDLIEYADHAGLDLRARLELFLIVCSAIHYGHQKGVVHRDLKPANILVDSEGQPKVIDFGVARVVDSGLTETPNETLAGQLLGTLHYMSPEQLGGDPSDVDTRSDVYSLGVVLFELLSGRRPHELEGIPIAQAVCRIREEEPERLGQVEPGLAGDLEWIVARALEKDPERRYPSASELAADVVRHLSQQPVVAGPPTAAYRLRKFVRRHRPAILAIAAVFLALALGLVRSEVARGEAERERLRARKAEGSALALAGRLENARSQEAEQRQRAEEERAEAEAQAALAEELVDFFERMLQAEHPDEVPAGVLDLASILDWGAENVGRVFADEPVAEADVRATLGITNTAIRRYDEAREQLQAALQLRREHLGLGDPKSIESTRYLLSNFHSSDPDRQLEVCREVYAAARAELGPAHPATLEYGLMLYFVLTRSGPTGESDALLEESWRFGRGVLGVEDRLLCQLAEQWGERLNATGRAAEAEEHLRTFTERCAAELGPAHLHTMKIRDELAILCMEQGRLDEAKELCLETLAHLEGTPEETSDAGLSVLQMFARIIRSEGQLDRARELFEEIVAAREREQGPNAFTTLAALDDLANVLRLQGDLEGAEAHYREAVDRWYAMGWPEHARALNVRNSLAVVLEQLGETGEAEDLWRGVLQDGPRVLGEGHRLLATAASHLVRILRDSGWPEEAETYAREALSRAEEARGPLSEEVHYWHQKLFRILLEQDASEAAEEVARDLVALGAERLGPAHPTTLLDTANLAHALIRQGELEEADELLRGALELACNELPDDREVEANLRLKRGQCLESMDRFEEAERELLTSRALFEEAVGSAHASTRGAVATLISLYERWGQPERAAALRKPGRDPGRSAER